MNPPHDVFPVESGENGLRVKGCVCELVEGADADAGERRQGERKETRPRDSHGSRLQSQARRRFKEVTTVARKFNTNETEKGGSKQGDSEETGRKRTR